MPLAYWHIAKIQSISVWKFFFAYCSPLIVSVVKSARFVALSVLKSKAQGCHLYWLRQEATEEAHDSTIEA